MPDLHARIAEILAANYSADTTHHASVADRLVRQLGWGRIADFCETQAALSWRDGMTADEAHGRNVVAEEVLAVLDGGNSV